MAVVNGDNYTYVDIVNDGTTTRHMIEDQEARGDISDLKSAFTAEIQSPGIGTVVKDQNTRPVKINVVTFTKLSDGVVNVTTDGAAKATAVYDFYNESESIPGWITKNQDYIIRVFANTDTVKAQVYQYSPSLTNLCTAVASDGNKTFRVASSAVGFRIRLTVESGNTVNNEVVYLRVTPATSEYGDLIGKYVDLIGKIPLINTIPAVTKSALQANEAVNGMSYTGVGTLVEDANANVVVINKITYSKLSNGFVSIATTGAATENAIYDFYNNSVAFPAWVTPGKKYGVQIYCPNDLVLLQVYQYNPTINRVVNAVASDGLVVFSTDADAAGFRIRLAVDSGNNPGNVSVYVKLFALDSEYGVLVETGKNATLPKLYTEQYNKMIDINHRGLQVMYPENSIPAFTASAVYGYHFVETDVQQTQDGVFILLHDGTTQRTTGATGNVADMTLTQIKALSLLMGSTDTGYKIPTLAEGMACFKANNLIPFIELKKETMTTANVPNLIAQLEATGQRYIIMSLEHGYRTDDQTEHAKLLEAVRAISPTIPVAVTVYNLTDDLVDDIYAEFGDNTIILVDERTSINQTIINHIHGKGLLLGAFTPATYNRYHALMAEGYDFALSNFLMNNHEIQGQTTLYYIGTNDSTGVDSWSVEISSSDAMRYRDVVRIRGLIKCASEVVIDGNSGGQPLYQALNITPTEWTPIDMQIYLRGSDPIQLSITPASGKLYYRNLSYTVTKCQR